MKYQKALTFSYDDGVEQDRRLIALFNKYGVKATMNLNTGIQNPDSSFDIEQVHISRMPQEGLRELYQGYEIAVHGLEHLSPVDLTKEQLDHEFLQNIEDIEHFYGTKPEGMAYAYGAYNDEVANYLDGIGLKYGRTVEATHGFDVPAEPLKLAATCHFNDEQLFELAEKFVKARPVPGEQMLFYIWGHSYEFDVCQNWDRMEQLLQMVSGKEDIFYGTNAECLKLFGCIE